VSDVRPSLGYQLAPIEQAVADGVPCTGDNHDDQLTAEDGDAPAGQQSSSGEAERGDPTSPDDTGSSKASGNSIRAEEDGTGPEQAESGDAAGQAAA